MVRYTQMTKKQLIEKLEELDRQLSASQRANGEVGPKRPGQRPDSEAYKILAEQALKESEERYRTLFEKTASPIMITDPEGLFIDWNEAVLEFLECSRVKLPEKNIHDFLPLETRKDAADRGKDYWKRERTVEAEYLVQGRTKIFELSMTPAALNGKDVVFGVGKDITERKQVEEKLAYMAAPS